MRKQEEAEARRAAGLETEEDETLKDEELKALDDRLRKAKIDKEAKLIIHEHVVGMETTIAKTMDDRGRSLDEKLTGGPNATTTQRKK